MATSVTGDDMNAVCRDCGVPISGSWAARGRCAPCQQELELDRLQGSSRPKAPAEQRTGVEESVEKDLRVIVAFFAAVGGIVYWVTSPPRPFLAISLMLMAIGWCVWWGVIAYVGRSTKVTVGLWRIFFLTGGAAIALTGLALVLEVGWVLSTGSDFLTGVGEAAEFVATSGNARAGRGLMLVFYVALLPGYLIYVTWLGGRAGASLLRRTAESLGGWKAALRGQ